jgi:hypothetical protein
MKAANHFPCKESLILLLALLAPACTPTETLPDSGWWSYRKDAAESSYYSGNDIRLPLENVWEREFTEGATRELHPPVFGPGRVYVAMTSAAMNPGVYNTKLLALRLSDGQTQWSFAPADEDITSATMEGSPIVSNGRIFVAFTVWLAEHRPAVRVYALRQDGTVDWTAHPAPPLAILYGGIIAANGLVLFCSQEGLGGSLYAIHQESGLEAWRTNLGELPPFGLRSETPVFLRQSNGTPLILVSTPRDLRAFRFDPPGSEAWRFTFPRSGANSTPVPFHWSPHNDPLHILVSVVILKSDGTDSVADVYRLSEGGTLVQSFELPYNTDEFSVQSHIAAWEPGIGYASDAVLVSGNSIRALSGWTVSDLDRRSLQSAPALASGFIFYTNSVRLHVLHMADGTQLWADGTMDIGLTHGSMLWGGVGIDQGFIVSCDGARVRAFRSAQ